MIKVRHTQHQHYKCCISVYMFISLTSILIHYYSLIYYTHKKEDKEDKCPYLNIWTREIIAYMDMDTRQRKNFHLYPPLISLFTLSKKSLQMSKTILSFLWKIIFTSTYKWMGSWGRFTNGSPTNLQFIYNVTIVFTFLKCNTQELLGYHYRMLTHVLKHKSLVKSFVLDPGSQLFLN